MNARTSGWLVGFLLGVAMGGAPACGEEATEPAPDYAGIALREEGWLRGDLHLHSTLSDGESSPSTVVALGEFFASEVFRAAHPEYAGNHLDFLALTDHDGAAGAEDPGWTSASLLLLSGVEYGLVDSHGNAYGHPFIAKDPDEDGISLADVQSLIASIEDSGGVFSINHPTIANLPWYWNATGASVEIWNGAWGGYSDPLAAASITSFEASYGPASEAIWHTTTLAGASRSEQALDFVEALLSRGHPKAFVGGSDRHYLFPVASPTTFIRAASVDREVLLDAIRQRHTFVARNPAAAQVLATVSYGGTSYQLGDEVPVPLEGAAVEVSVRAGRALGGRVRLVRGTEIDTGSPLPPGPLGQSCLDEPVTSADQSYSMTLEVLPGDWLYPLVLEPLIAPGLTSAEADQVRALAQGIAGMSAAELLPLVLTLVDPPELFFDAFLCDPAAWRPDMLQCIPVDPASGVNFFVPDRFDRALNVVVVDGQATEWTMGAVGSPLRFVAR